MSTARDSTQDLLLSRAAASGGPARSGTVLSGATTATTASEEEQTLMGRMRNVELSKEDRQEGYDTSLLALQPRGNGSTSPSAPTGLDVSRSNSRPFSVATSASSYSVDEDDSTIPPVPQGGYTGLAQVHEEDLGDEAGSYPPHPSPPTEGQSFIAGGGVRQSDPFASPTPAAHPSHDPFDTPLSSPHQSAFSFSPPRPRSASPSPSHQGVPFFHITTSSASLNGSEKHQALPSITGRGSAGRASTRGWAAQGYEKRAKELEESRRRSSGGGGMGGRRSGWFAADGAGGGEKGGEESKPWWKRRIGWVLMALGLLLVIAIAVGAGVGMATKKSNAAKSEADAAASSSSSTDSSSTDSASATDTATDSTTSLWPTSDWAVQPSATSEWVDSATATATTDWSTATATDSWDSSTDTATWDDGSASSTSWDDGSGSSGWGRRRRGRALRM
ncbi:hypothetical protein BCR35DRAFT_353365 [Leucosporidium creatinivorum]|uniref:Uncharacterized protein n=1 Tax=Leucosporidium creatinivorum TaxID=106004 RepID=A0A1Y2EY80_9BASI|nr:hypothetical protein BCR35DRAFT_353365 [Leucosporidium creatinivorum]